MQPGWTGTWHLRSRLCPYFTAQPSEPHHALLPPCPGPQTRAAWLSPQKSHLHVHHGRSRCGLAAWEHAAKLVQQPPVKVADCPCFSESPMLAQVWTLPSGGAWRPCGTMCCSSTTSSTCMP